MLQTLTAPRGVVTAPHHLAAEAGGSALREGGYVIEAMVAAAATIAVVYPHMNSIGGDAFRLISEPLPRRSQRARSVPASAWKRSRAVESRPMKR